MEQHNTTQQPRRIKTTTKNAEIRNGGRKNKSNLSQLAIYVQPGGVEKALNFA